ncbi:MAG: hypothetical protein E7525_05080 [Ruminococcaceae bacterium]|nr:hypothetical protein [Oscillospiraceae bacterium]
MIIDRYHSNANITNVNAEHRRAYYVPFGSPDEVFSTSREESSRFKLLSGGKWAFRFFDSYEDIPNNITDASTDIASWERIPVPSCWELQGHGTPQFSKSQYGFPKDVPNIPKKNPTGVYAIDFTIHDDIDVYSKYVVFEGVSSCVYLYINGEFAGYSQGSHSFSEFDITGFLKPGRNRLTAVVTKWCDGSYLESYDDWEMSGIFRDVYLLVRPKGHVEDIFVKTCVSDDYKTADISIEIESPIANESIVTLFNANGEKLDATVFNDDGTAEFSVEDPRLWSAEYPELYKLVIESGNEFITVPVGIRTVSSDHGVFRFNGRPIKLFGVNFHGFSSKNGLCYSYEEMRKDLIMMKRNNINAIRTADYPAEPRFYELCDKIGFYVIAEAEINCSGMGDEQNRRLIVDNPLWEPQLLDRVMSTVETMKNSPSIVMWSAGNNSGYGRALKSAIEEIKSRDNTRLAIYHSDSAIDDIDSTVRFHPSSLDVISEKNIRFTTCREICQYINEHDINKPFVLSEYCPTAGNGAARMYSYFEQINEFPCFAGAFIYEWGSRAISIGKSENGKNKYLTFDGVGGLVNPEGKTLPALKDHKNLAKPFLVTPISLEEGRFTVKNGYNFSYMSRLEGNWELTRNGEVVSSGHIPSTAIPPQREEELVLGYQIPDDGHCYLKISFASYGNDFIPDGEIVGFTQFKLPTESYFEEKLTFGSVFTDEDLKTVAVFTDNFEYIYEKSECAFSSLKLNGKELLKSGMKFNVWRAVTDADKKESEKWRKLGLDRAETHEYDTELHPGDGFVTIISKGIIAAAGLEPLFNFKVEWSVFANGLIELHSEVETANGINFATENPLGSKDISYLPRFGLSCTMDKSFDTVEFFGYGPFDSYCDRHNASYMGKFTNRVSREMTDFIRPQESGNHYKTSWGYVRNSSGLGLVFSNETDPFDFSAIPYSPKELGATAQSCDLPQSDKTVVSIDYKQNGLSYDTLNFGIADSKFIFNVSILPTEVSKNYPM